MIATGYQREFEEFVRASSDRLVRIAFLLTGDRHHAEDIAQTALERTARRWRSARRDPGAYARRAVVNLVKDRRRLLSRRPAETAWAYDVAVPVTDRVADRDELVRALRALPLGQRSVPVLRYFEDLSVSETAQVLGCTAGTVKSQTARGLTSLRAALKETDSSGHSDTGETKEHSHVD
ncbi:SigE family RNA polymerase sigma factor [Nocardioides sp.]|uniref:SigE family RNA polymerase sigma factor n=1 Tax=Nocardioides sp. TaxID=35761 RepID=UPI002609B03E|nr:SigE family RNA polymerase sigma factor [Nocardioides sp.]